MRETPSGIFCDHLRETSTSAHLISCYLTDGRALSIPGLFQNRQKARKLGLLRPLPLQIIMKKSVILPRGKNLHFLQKGWGKTVDIILRQARQLDQRDQVTGLAVFVFCSD